MSVLALILFSSAFDTVDHSFVVHRINTYFGFTVAVLQRFSSYLTDRTLYVSLFSHCSVFPPVHSGVPQGSVLDDILFTMYTNPLSVIINSHSIIHHSLANDLQLQMSASTDKIFDLLHSMYSCACYVKSWANVNMHKLYDNKTDLILVTSIGTKHLHNLHTTITFGNAEYLFKQSVMNLDLTFYYECTCLQCLSDLQH